MGRGRSLLFRIDLGVIGWSVGGCGDFIYSFGFEGLRV